MRSLAVLMAFCALFIAPSAFAQVDYEALKHVDLRDLNANPTYLTGSAGVILEAMRANPARFVGPVNGQGIPERSALTRVVYYASGARGPKGDRVVGNDGKAFWQLDADQAERTVTRENTIFSAEIEEIDEVAVNKTFKLKIVLFVHDPANPVAVVSNGYYFRRLTVQVDWFNSTDPEKLFQVLSLDQEIPLTATQFQVVGDILDRKVVLEDVVFGITKVFPLGVGSFNIRTGQNMDGNVKSMTREFPEGKVVKASGPVETCNSSNNTRCRTYPWYYRGRPFIGILTPDGNYHSIGMHWQIDANKLDRGFVSHGCIRVRDKDLYQLDAILNEGTLSELRVSYRYHQAGKYERLTHPMPHKNDTYWASVYSVKRSGDKIQCQHSTYDVQRDSRNPQIHTVADNDCLTMVVEVKRPATDVTNYLMGYSPQPPMGLYSGGLEHVPLAVEGGDAGAFDCWESDGGAEERQHARNGFERFFQGLGNIFRGGSSNRRMTCDERIRAIPADNATPRQAPISMTDFPGAPVIIVQGNGAVRTAPVVPAANVTTTNSAGIGTTSAAVTTTATTVTPGTTAMILTGGAAPVAAPVADQAAELASLKQFFTQNCEPRIRRGQEAACKATAIRRLTIFDQTYCHPVREGYSSYCATWASQMVDWQSFGSQQ